MKKFGYITNLEIVIKGSVNRVFGSPYRSKADKKIKKILREIEIKFKKQTEKILKGKASIIFTFSNPTVTRQPNKLNGGYR